MNKQLWLLIATVILSGCGTFNHHQQTYYVKEVVKDGERQTPPDLRVQIVPTVSARHIPFFYYSRKWGGPFSILFSGTSIRNVCTHFILHSIKLKSENRVLEEKHFAVPPKLDLCGLKLGYRNNHVMYRYRLADSFKFNKGQKIDLEIKYERANGHGVDVMLLQGMGEEVKSRSSLFDAYMGV